MVLHVYVAEKGNCRIQVFSAAGQYLRHFPETENKQLQKPSGLCIDKYQNVLVGDKGNHRICIFDSNGQLITFFSRPGELLSLYGLVVDSSGFLYIANREKNIKIF